MRLAELLVRENHHEAENDVTNHVSERRFSKTTTAEASGGCYSDANLKAAAPALCTPAGTEAVAL